MKKFLVSFSMMILSFGITSFTTGCDSGNDSDEHTMNAERAISMATVAIVEADDRGCYVESAEILLSKAEQWLYRAYWADNDGDFNHAVDYAREAERTANQAINTINCDGLQSEEEHIDSINQPESTSTGNTPFPIGGDDTDGDGDFDADD